jgi:hypothetical protein
MIQPLRKIHRYSFFLLALVLPCLFVLAVAMRPPVLLLDQSVAHSLPVAPVVQFQAVVSGRHVMLSLHRLPDTTSTRYVLQSDHPEIPLPELLLYSSSSQPGEKLPSDSQLLSSIKLDRPFVVSSRISAPAQLVLYDAAHQLVLASAPLEAR